MARLTTEVHFMCGFAQQHLGRAFLEGSADAGKATLGV
jgi:hypothetical protein